MSRNGDWMQTYSGRQFWPLDPRPDEIHIEDIGHALSNQCRFAGHCRTFYSVAEHSVRVAEIVPPDEALWALLHDAPEAYLVDLPRPLKRSAGFAPRYREVEDRLMAVVCERFGLPVVMPERVKEADNVLLMTEARDLMRDPPVTWKDAGAEPLSWRIKPWHPAKAKAEFMLAFARLG